MFHVCTLVYETALQLVFYMSWSFLAHWMKLDLHGNLWENVSYYEKSDFWITWTYHYSTGFKCAKVSLKSLNFKPQSVEIQKEEIQGYHYPHRRDLATNSKIQT